MPRSCDEDILGLNVTVNKPKLVEIMQTSSYLRQIKPTLICREESKRGNSGSCIAVDIDMEKRCAHAEQTKQMADSCFGLVGPLQRMYMYMYM